MQRLCSWRWSVLQEQTQMTLPSTSCAVTTPAASPGLEPNTSTRYKLQSNAFFWFSQCIIIFIKKMKACFFFVALNWFKDIYSLHEVLRSAERDGFVEWHCVINWTCLFAGHLRVQNMRSAGVSVLLHWMRQSLSQGSRLQVSAPARAGPIDDAFVHWRWLTDIMMLSRHRDNLSLAI